MHGLDWHLTLVVGIALASALVGGLIAAGLRLPKVTAYLLIGLILGPQVFGVIRKEEIHSLDVINKLAMALVLFNIGCHFAVRSFRSIFKRTLGLSIGELSVTFALVAFGLFTLGHPWQLALMLGVLALATAPATTVLVLKENKAEGPVTEYTTMMVVLNNLVTLFAFEVVLFTIQFFTNRLTLPIEQEIHYFARDFFGSIGLGLLAGAIVSYATPLVGMGRLFVLLIAVSTLVLGVCQKWEIPYLLSFLAMGMAVANLSDQVEGITGELDRFTGLLCVVFFVIHGAEFDFRSLFSARDVGLIALAVAYLVFRTVGKYGGVYLAARALKEPPQVRRWLGATLISQAGAAIALVTIVAKPLEEGGLGELGQRMQVVILSTVVVFELVGPILIQMAVRQAGEVPFSVAILHTTTGPIRELGRLCNRILLTFGYDPWHTGHPTQVKVSKVMRHDVKRVSSRATFNDVIDLIEHSRDNTYPVIDDTGALVGIIRYRDLQDVLFDPDASNLIYAEDMAGPVNQVLYAQDSIADMRPSLQDGLDDCIFVVTCDDQRKLLGVVRRREALQYYARSGILDDEESSRDDRDFATAFRR